MRERKPLLVAALVISVIAASAITSCAMVIPARAEPGDKLDYPIRQHSSALANKAAGGRQSPPEYATAIGGSPYGCPARAWCGCWLSQYLGLNDRSLWVARNWLKLGTPITRPMPGVVAIYARGKRGGHVGLVRAVHGRNIVLLSGNDNGSVRERERTTNGIIGYRKI